LGIWARELAGSHLRLNNKKAVKEGSMRLIGISLIAMLWLTACAPAAPAAQPHEISPLPTGEWVFSGSEVALIVFERAGGFAGISEVWRFYKDGRVVKMDKQQKTTIATQLPPEVIEEAAQCIIGEGFMDLADEYMPANPCCDRFTYRLTIVHTKGVKTVTTMDGVDWPPALAKAMKVVNQLISQTTIKR